MHVAEREKGKSSGAPSRWDVVLRLRPRVTGQLRCDQSEATSSPWSVGVFFRRVALRGLEESGTHSHSAAAGGSLL